MATEEWEQNKLLEVEGLQRLVTLYNVFLNEYAEIREEFGEHLDDDLVTTLNMIEYMVAVALEAEVQPDENRPSAPGIVKQLDDAMDEVQTFQAGIAPKRGVPDENGGDDDQKKLD